MSTRAKIKRLQMRDGENCWLCQQPMSFEAPFEADLSATLDHVVPRKWGGSNKYENLKLAHRVCNGKREKRYPQTLVFTMSELQRLTNPNMQVGGFSWKAQKYLRRKGLLPARQIIRQMETAVTAYHPDMPIEML